MNRLLDEAKTLNYDYVLLDLGPGSQSIYLELMSRADQRLFVATPEPSAVEKTYRLIENYLLHLLEKNAPADCPVGKMRPALEKFRHVGKPSPIKFRNFLEAELGWTWSNDIPMPNQSVRLIINQARADGDHDLGRSLKLVCHHYFGYPIQFAGSLVYDNAVWQSFRDTEPMLYKNPFSPLAGQFLGLTREITNSEIITFPFKAVV
jgi:flagellar biosynthesis protein FlhG